jgi:hypothetical protein
MVETIFIMSHWIIIQAEYLVVAAVFDDQAMTIAAGA